MRTPNDKPWKGWKEVILEEVVEPISLINLRNQARPTCQSHHESTLWSNQPPSLQTIPAETKSGKKVYISNRFLIEESTVLEQYWNETLVSSLMCESKK
ncbi:hypothetical protein TNCV_3323861 [Trichonephila clavipes]|nr:hypothetical protein TNCV_3323861 [Trichonephila clavipes]